MEEENNRTYIIDATLREGNQSPGVQFQIDQTVEIALALNQINIDMIEVGHPYASNLETERVRSVKQLKLNSPILAHARAKEEDIYAVAKSGANWIGIFAGINEIARKTRLNNRSVPEVFSLVKEAITLAKDLGLKIRYTAEDSSRTSIDLILKAFEVAINAGADRICFADSVGILEPFEIYETIKTIKSTFPRTDLEVHCHNDRGLAIANSLAAIDAGANWISTSINGIGERCGITDTCVLMANLHYRENRKLPSPDLLGKISILVEALTRSTMNHRYPIIGKHAFTHSAKLHRDAVNKDEKAYSWAEPSKFGRKNVTEISTLPRELSELINIPQVISATELKYHRHGPGQRFVMIDERFVKDCRQYCIVREVNQIADEMPSHVDSHRHSVDSLFLFLGKENCLKGLVVEVRLGNEIFKIESPASVFIPSGLEHSYRFISGSGLYINHVLSGSYNESLLEKYFLFLVETSNDKLSVEEISV